MRREFPRRIKIEIIRRAMNDREQICCEGCGQVLGHKRFDIDHVIPEGLVVDKTKSLTAKDGQLLGVDCCHRGGRNKTADDVRTIAKARRVEHRHLGIKNRSTFRKPPPGYGYDWRRRCYVRLQETR